MKKKILLIRHGESEADILNVHEGRADFPLTSLGISQGQLLAAYLPKHYSVEAVYCSTLKRAHSTAELVAKAFGLNVKATPTLMEFNNGLLAGLSYEQAEKLYPERHDLSPYESVYMQESKVEFRTRAQNAIGDILKEDNASTVAVVSHGGTINQIICSLLQLPVESNVAFAMGDTAFCEIEITDKRIIVRKINCQSHLDK